MNKTDTMSEKELKEIFENTALMVVDAMKGRSMKKWVGKKFLTVTWN